MPVAAAIGTTSYQGGIATRGCALRLQLPDEANQPVSCFTRTDDGSKNPLRVKFDLLKYFNVIWVVQSPLAKIFWFPSTPNRWLFPRRPNPTKRADRASSRNAGRDVVDARASVRKVVAGRG